jgi:tetratricopeptide (TPR) repeat protein
MTVVGFAEHLGVSTRTVSKWESRGSDIEPLPEMQAALDTALTRSSPETIRRFQALCPNPGEPMPDAEADLEDLQTSNRPSLPVSTQIVDELTALRASLVRSDALLGPGRLIATVGEQVANVQDMLGSSHGELRQRVFELAALYAEFHGWLLEDAGQPIRGQAWTARSLEWAQAGENPDLAAYTLMRRAQQAVSRQDAALTIGLARAAGRVEGVSARIRSASAQQQAHGLAVEGEQTQALTALDQAEALLDGEPAEDVEGDAYALAEWCTPAYVTAQRANVYLTLGRSAEAVHTFTVALESWPAEYRRERGLHLARKARALAVDRRPDEAVAAGGEALTIARNTGSRRTLDELRVVARLAAEQGAGGSDVTDFAEAVMMAVHGGGNAA